MWAQRKIISQIAFYPSLSTFHLNSFFFQSLIFMINVFQDSSLEARRQYQRIEAPNFFFFIYKKWEIVRNGGRVMDRERCRKCWKEERWRKLDASYQKSKHVDLFFWEVDWASFWPYIVLSLVFSLPSRKAVAGEKRSFIGARLREGVSLQLFFCPLLLLLRYHILLSL